MIRLLILSLIVSITLSFLWWPSAKNENAIFELIDKERAWQTEHLGFDLVSKTDEGIRTIVNTLLTSPIPSGPQSTLPYSERSADEEIKAAVHRVFQKPYWQAMFALLVLAIGRILVTGLMGLSLAPLLVAVLLDAHCAREVRYAQFKPLSSMTFRIAMSGFFIILELMIILSVAPIWINPNFILLGFVLLGGTLHQMLVNYYK